MTVPFTKIEDRRPWGRFTQYVHNQPVTVKIIEVSPAGKLSVQRHRHRDECWIALDEGLVAFVDSQVIGMSSEREVWIPRGTIHSVENRGGQAARFLEIAFGNFDEQDIERLEDCYGRA